MDLPGHVHERTGRERFLLCSCLLRPCPSQTLTYQRVLLFHCLQSEQEDSKNAAGSQESIDVKPAAKKRGRPKKQADDRKMKVTHSLDSAQDSLQNNALHATSLSHWVEENLSCR